MDVPRCPRCGGVHPEMYEPAWYDDYDDENYPHDPPDTSPVVSLAIQGTGLTVSGK